jgi:hypothetical protein
MNVSGSDVSKEAADMILLGQLYHIFHGAPLLTVATSDDNFASIVSEYKAFFA